MNSSVILGAGSKVREDSVKRKKKEVLKVPKKFEPLLEEAKKGTLDVLDFSNAELGDAQLKLLFEVILTNQKAK